MNSFTKICILFLVFSVNISLVYAKQSLTKKRIHQEALSAAKKGDYGVAYRKWLSLAKNGNTDAQYNIATMYVRGDGLQKNNKLSLYWFLQAAKRGHVESQFMLGKIYYDGISVRRSYTKSFAWLHKAAKQGHSKARNNLALMYYHGRGVKKDLGKAFKWSLKVSENNLISTEHPLGQ